jgi:guanine deaminase
MELYENYYLSYNDLGIIEYFGTNSNDIPNFENQELIDLSHQIIIPGLIDLHTHIPQYPALGIGTGTLLEWLENFIFPLETKFDNKEFAYNLSSIFFKECIKFGTTTVVAYSNSGYEGTDSAFQAAQNSKIKAYIGNSLMDFNLPENNSKSNFENIEISNKLIHKWHSESGKLKYILTPRYALVCSIELMKWVGATSKENNLKIQTHLAENKNELIEISKAYPQYPTYTDVYYNAGILGENTLLAHCIYLSDSEINLIKSTGSKIIHCPSSNKFLQSGIFPFMELKNNLPVGIGTDVAGGTSLSILSELKEAVETSKVYNLKSDSINEPLNPSEALWTATKGNSMHLGLDNHIGDFKIGLFADFISFDIERLNLFDSKLDADNISGKLLYLLTNQYVDSTYINGEKIQ